MVLGSSVIAPLRAITKKYDLEVSDRELQHIVDFASRKISEFSEKDKDHIHFSRRDTGSIFKLSMYPKRKSYYLDLGKYGKQFGSGAQKRCRLGIDLGNLTPVAILQSQSSSTFFSNGRLREIHRSHEILKRISDISKADLVTPENEAFYKGSKSGQLTERYEQILPLAQSTLYEWRKCNQEVSIEEKLEIMLSLATDLQEIFKHGFCHRDIKPENILGFKENGRTVFKLHDFDLACHESEHERLDTTCGTPAYMPLEVLRNGHGYVSILEAQRGDVYSLGMTFHFLFHGKNHPLISVLENTHPKHPKFNKLTQLAFAKWHRSCRSQGNLEVNELIFKMTHLSESVRPDLSEVIAGLQNIINNQNQGLRKERLAIMC